MKEVDIISKVVGRETGKPVGAGGSFSGVDLSGYLLKAIWDKAWDLRTDGNGREYVFGKLPVVLQYGLATYTDGGEVDLPTIFAGLPIDGQTLYWEETTNEDGSVTKVLKAKAGEGGGGTADSVDWNNITGKPSWIGSTKPSYSWSEITSKPSWIGSSKPSYSYSEITGTPSSLKNPYALTFGTKTYDGSSKKTILASDLGALTSHQTIYSLSLKAGTFSELTYNPASNDESINIPTTTSHVAEGSRLYFTEDRAIKALENTLKGYVDLTNDQEINGVKNFRDIRINGGVIEYNSQGYWKLNGNLLVTGDIAAYSSDGQESPFILDVSSVNLVASMSTTQVYSARVTTLVKNKAVSAATDAASALAKLQAIKDELGSITETSLTSAIRTALINIRELL